MDVELAVLEQVTAMTKMSREIAGTPNPATRIDPERTAITSSVAIGSQAEWHAARLQKRGAH